MQYSLAFVAFFAVVGAAAAQPYDEEQAEPQAVYESEGQDVPTEGSFDAVHLLSPREIHDMRRHALAVKRRQHNRRHAGTGVQAMNAKSCHAAQQEVTVLKAEVNALKQENHLLKKRQAAQSKKKKAGLISHHRGALRHRVSQERREESVENADADTNGGFPSMSGLFSSMGWGSSQAETKQAETAPRASSDDQSQVDALKAQLQEARRSLGKAEEEKQHLQDKVSDLESATSEKDSELAAASLKAQSDSLTSVNTTKQVEEQLEQQLTQEKADAESEKDSLEAKLAQKEEGTKKLSEEVKVGEVERRKLKQELNSQLSGEGVFAAQKFEAERRHEEDTLKSEAVELQNLEGTEGKCMAWGKRLEVKLQHVLTSRRNDARLCRDGILSLHDERSKLHEQLRQTQATIAAAKHGQEEAEKSSAEDQNLLSRCLDEVQQLQRPRE